MTRIYFNLHKKLFSVQQKVNGRWKVVKHANAVYLKNGKFKVSEAGRQRVLKEKKKNVHAFVEGEEAFDFKSGTYCGVTYNPYKHSTFVKRGTEEPVREFDILICQVTDEKPYLWLTSH